MKYSAVIFDLFGTLVDIFSRREYDSVIVAMAATLKVPYDDFYKIWMQTATQRGNGMFRTLEENLEYICRELKINVTDRQIWLARRTRFDYVARVLTPREDAIETLAQLKAKGYKIGLVSNCSTEPPVIWPDTPFAPFFDAAIFSSTAGTRKPDPRIFQMALEQLKVAPQRCLYVADGDGDELPVAAKMGMTPVLIKVPQEDYDDEFREDDRTDTFTGTVITSLKEVLNLVE
ncbi:MAG: HAD family hydrolase [Dehalococcoidales bacterium]